VFVFYVLIDGELLKRAIELKQHLTDLMSRENKITYYGDSDDDCSSESDMEEVLPKSCADDLLAQCLAKTDNNVLTRISVISSMKSCLQ